LTSKNSLTSEKLRIRTKEFAHRCVKLALALERTKLGNHISGQLIRCSTSVAANYRASCLAQSRSHFRSKLSIVLEESDESLFWIEFAVEEKLVRGNKVKNLIKEAQELTAIFYSTRKTLSIKK
ncbi:MAG: four helix bundle protein, partial [Planctomycetes bacterium]|nr:four helix bundle protein [Planctomycetota bacterium]MBU1518799.1 four helix bundle protein [Planctomycetota bacterium]MBU2458053.1 four helix bundle protein [Planctomycetota bacterium]